MFTFQIFAFAVTISHFPYHISINLDQDIIFNQTVMWIHQKSFVFSINSGFTRRRTKEMPIPYYEVSKLSLSLVASLVNDKRQSILAFFIKDKM